jgi:redox-sensitive bicupin YhaK (pirin superfamily)
MTAFCIECPRKVETIVIGRQTSDGAGVKLTRVLDQNLHARLDPFLLMDAFGSDNPDEYIAGFPSHPHRGFETVTYMIAGKMAHEDSEGNKGVLEDGGVQWMTAGRGVFHSEIPQQSDGRMEGFQLWLNLPARDKMCAPWYRDFKARELPKFVTREGVGVTVIAGKSHDTPGAMQRATTTPLYLDLHFSEGASFAQKIQSSHNAFVYVYRGALHINSQLICAGQMALLENDPSADGVFLNAEKSARALLIAGQPLNEPIVQHGPIVMNTKDEIRQAISDLHQKKFTVNSSK